MVVRRYIRREFTSMVRRFTTAEGALADLIAIPINPAYEIHGAVVHHRGPVTASMIEGAWAIPPAA